MNDPLIVTGIACERTCAELLIYLGDVHPSIVTEKTGILPTGQVVKGELGKRNSLGRAPMGKLNAWFLSSEEFVQSLELGEHLNWLLGKLVPVKSALLSLQQEPGVRMRVECPWWVAVRSQIGGPSLEPNQMRSLADLNLTCSIVFSAYESEAFGPDNTVPVVV